MVKRVIFSPLQIILGAKVVNVVGDVMYFNVDVDGDGDGDGRLQPVYSASDVWMSANISVIRVVTRLGKKWFLDPPFQERLLYCSLGVFQKIPLHNLNWDLVYYQWKKPNVNGNGTHLQFFQYLVKLGRILLLQSKYKCPAPMKHWAENNVHELQLAKFWKWF